jgi:hypothetical protein
LIAYLAAREQRYAIRSPSLSITGSTSSCCKSQTFERFGSIRCYQCRQPCTERTWTAPRNGSMSRGGGNRILMRETRHVDGEGEQRRRWSAWIEYRPLERLFARPARATHLGWDRILAAWTIRVHPECGSDRDAAAFGAQHAPEADLWTEDNVREWVREGRAVVVQRLTGIPARQRAARPRHAEDIERIRGATCQSASDPSDPSGAPARRAGRQCEAARAAEGRP